MPTNASFRHVADAAAAMMVTATVRALRSRLPAGEEAEDLVGLALLGLVHADRRFDPSRGTAFRTFAIATMRGEILGGIRTMLAQSGRTKEDPWERVALDDIAESFLVEEACPADSYERAVIRCMLARAITALPERERQVIHDYFYAEMTYTQIARRLGLSQTRVYQIKDEACRRLRSQLGPYEQLF